VATGVETVEEGAGLLAAVWIEAVERGIRAPRFGRSRVNISRLTGFSGSYVWRNHRAANTLKKARLPPRISNFAWFFTRRLTKASIKWTYFADKSDKLLLSNFD
jgi:hypothetical protein